MSIAAINDFFKALDTNENLSKEFEALNPDENYKQNIIKLANKFNYVFTLEELETVVNAANNLKKQEAEK